MRLILALSLVFLGACENRNESSPRPKPKGYKSANADLAPKAEPTPDTGIPQAPAPVTSVPVDGAGQDEVITPPGNISGAFLVCSFLKAATDALPSADVGCRFVDNDGGRADMGSIAEKAIFDVTPPPGVQVKITPNPNSDWEALYTFTGKNAADTTNGAMVSLIVVNFQNTASGDAAASIKEELWEVELPLYEWAPACKNNACAFKQINTGLYWAYSPDQTYDHKAAIAACEALTYAGYVDWRLPTQAEMQKAYEEKITAMFYPEKLNLAVRTKYWSSTLEGATNAMTIDWFLPAVSFSPLDVNSPNARAICVR